MSPISISGWTRIILIAAGILCAIPSMSQATTTSSSSGTVSKTANILKNHPKQIQDAVNFALNRLRTLTSIDTLTLHHIVRHSTKPMMIETTVKQAVYRNIQTYDARGRVVMKPMLTHRDKAVRVIIDTSIDLTLQLIIPSDIASVSVNADGTIDSDTSTSTSTTPRIMTVHITVSIDKDKYMGITQYRVIDLHDFTPTVANDDTIPKRQSSYLTHPLFSSHLVHTSNNTSITIMCVNLWNYNHWKPRIPLIAAELKRINPDVIGFQEVRARKMSPHKEHRFQVEDVANMLPGYQYVYVPAMGFKEGDHEYVHEGIAILSRYPIIETDHLKLTRDPHDGNDFHHRICLRAKIDTPIGLINVMSTHLSLSEQARNRTLPEIGRYAAKLSEPSVLVGDFNCVFEDQNILTEHGFHDAWLALHGDKSQEAGWTFNSWDPKSRIDYTFLRGLRAESISVEGREGISKTGLEPLAGVNDMKDMLYPSDHRFLAARVVRDDMPASKPSTTKPTTTTSSSTSTSTSSSSRPHAVSSADIDDAMEVDDISSPADSSIISQQHDEL